MNLHFTPKSGEALPTEPPGAYVPFDHWDGDEQQAAAKVASGWYEEASEPRQHADSPVVVEDEQGQLEPGQALPLVHERDLPDGVEIAQPAEAQSIPEPEPGDQAQPTPQEPAALPTGQAFADAARAQEATMPGASELDPSLPPAPPAE